VLTLTSHPDDDRPQGGWCLGANRNPHWSDDVTRHPPEVGPALCAACALRHRDRLADRTGGPS
jgi:hypothetical protein